MHMLSLAFLTGLCILRGSLTVFLLDVCLTVSIISFVVAFAVVTLIWFVIVATFGDTMFLSAMFARLPAMTLTAQSDFYNL